jgi:hypothetical protein
MLAAKVKLAKTEKQETHKHSTNEGKVSLLLILNLILKEK